MWTGRTLLQFLNCIAANERGAAGSQALGDAPAGGGAAAPVECHWTMAILIIPCLPIAGILLACNAFFWALFVLPVALIGTILCFLFVFLLGPLFPAFLVLLALIIDLFLILGFPIVLVLVIIFMTIRHPISMALYNVIWGMVLMLALLALIFVDTFVQLGGDSAGLLLYASIDTRQSASCHCTCLYQIAKPKMYILLGVTIVAIVQLCNHLGRGCKNLTRGNRNHSLITTNYKIPIVVAIKVTTPLIPIPYPCHCYSSPIVMIAQSQRSSSRY
jgi:hypothetical protein